MHLDDVALFVRIVELGTLSAAARERNVPVSQVTRALVRLEHAVGVRLLHRTTHGLSLTDEGDTFLAHARRLGDTAAELQGALSGRRDGPSGWVRVSVSAIVAEAVIVPALPSLYARHPQLQLDIAVEDRLVDMARDGIDVAIRTGTPASETLVARQIGRFTRALYAAPAYATRHGLPLRADDLPAHRLVGNSAIAAQNQWLANPAEADQALPMRAHTRTDNSAVVLSLVLHGVGIGRLMDIVARPLVAAGRLLPVLPGLGPSAATPVYAVMLRERQRLPKLRACIDHWAAWLAQPDPAD
ncbi:LysR family transcriptional regulator [Rubrivivax albus]|uniref:LysR family transcriptional regulator n=1 Tax=Rubrivivax albus TaxID=2499835 RepID=A0A437JWA7_9BURK|nr:LysR family transcriptional regulator [Rubrivivax albus]RVT51662.1 LysR family transcriptional regulator [Rubrivivax albus]